jgi:rRNA maturation endonuclease Nob1
MPPVSACDECGEEFKDEHDECPDCGTSFFSTA